MPLFKVDVGILIFSGQSIHGLPREENEVVVLRQCLEESAATSTEAVEELDEVVQTSCLGLVFGQNCLVE